MAYSCQERCRSVMCWHNWLLTHQSCHNLFTSKAVRFLRTISASSFVIASSCLAWLLFSEDIIIIIDTPASLPSAFMGECRFPSFVSIVAWLPPFGNFVTCFVEVIGVQKLVDGSFLQIACCWSRGWLVSLYTRSLNRFTMGNFLGWPGITKIITWDCMGLLSGLEPIEIHLSEIKTIKLYPS